MILVSFIWAPCVCSRRGYVFESRVYVLHSPDVEPSFWLEWFPDVLPRMPFALVTVWVKACILPWNNHWFRVCILTSWFVACFSPTRQLGGWTGTLPQLGGRLCGPPLLFWVKAKSLLSPAKAVADLQLSSRRVFGRHYLTMCSVQSSYFVSGVPHLLTI